MTNTMFFRRGERLDGAKNWTKCPSETWRGHGRLRAVSRSTQGRPPSRSASYLELPGVAVSLHVVLDAKNAVDGRVGAVFTLSLQLEGRSEDDVSLRTQRGRYRDNRSIPARCGPSLTLFLLLVTLVKSLNLVASVPCVWTVAMPLGS